MLIDDHVALAAVEQCRPAPAPSRSCRRRWGRPAGRRRSAGAGRSGWRARSGSRWRDRLEGVRLADDALLQLRLRRQDGPDLVGDHLADRDAGPAGDHLGDRLARRRTTCMSGVSPWSARQLVRSVALGSASAAQLGRLVRAVGSGSRERLELLAQLADLRRPAPARPPSASSSAAQLGLRRACRVALGHRVSVAVVAAGRRLALEDPDLDLELLDPAAAVLDRRRGRRSGRCATRAQAVSSRLTALSGSCRPGM